MKVLSLALLLLAGCATTLESSWKSPELASRSIRRFAVFAAVGSPTERVRFEQAMAKGLHDKGLDAIPGTEFVSFDEHPTKDALVQLLRSKGIEAALVTKVVDRNTTGYTQPVWVGTPSYGGFYDYWYAPAAVSSYTVETTTYKVDTVLYDLVDVKPMWAARASTTRDRGDSFAYDIAGEVASELRLAGLVPR